MNGKALLEALSFVDEKYVEEAETKAIPRSVRRPMAKLLPLAACLVLILAALYGMDQLNVTPETSGNEGQNMQDMVEGADSPIGEENRSQASQREDSNQEIVEVPSLILRVEAMTGEGFTATVAELVDTDIIPVGTTLNVVLEEDTRHVHRDGAADTILDPSADLEGALVMVQFIRYDKETATIYVNQLFDAASD